MKSEIDSHEFNKHQPVTNKYKILIEGAREKLLEAAGSNSKEDGWKSFEVQKDVLITRKVVEGSPLTIQKGIGEIKATPEVVAAVIINLSHHEKWDPLFKKGEVVEAVDNHTQIIYAQYGNRIQCIGTSPRDFCYALHWEKDNRGNYFIVGNSVEHPSCPISPSCKRGDIIGSGWVISPKKNDKSTCKLTYVTQLDLKGLSPTVVAELPLSIANIRKLLPKLNKAKDTN